MSTQYEPTSWQQQHPLGSYMLYVGLTGRDRVRVRVGKASARGVRVKFPQYGWQTVHPDGLSSLPAT